MAAINQSINQSLTQTAIKQTINQSINQSINHTNSDQTNKQSINQVENGNTKWAKSFIESWKNDLFSLQNSRSVIHRWNYSENRISIYVLWDRTFAHNARRFPVLGQFLRVSVPNQRSVCTSRGPGRPAAFQWPVRRSPAWTWFRRAPQPFWCTRWTNRTAPPWARPHIPAHRLSWRAGPGRTPPPAQRTSNKNAWRISPDSRAGTAQTDHENALTFYRRNVWRISWDTCSKCRRRSAIWRGRPLSRKPNEKIPINKLIFNTYQLQSNFKVKL